MIHFVYKVPRRGGLVGRVLDKIFYTFPFITPLWRNGHFISWPFPLKSPYSISYNLLTRLQKRDKVKFYDLYEKTICPLKPDDIFLGQPMVAIDHSDWRDPKNYLATARTLDAFPKHKKSFIILPYTHDKTYVGTVKGLIEKHGDNVILVCGKIWTDNWERSPFGNRIKNKLRVDMAIDADNYPSVRTSFNPQGKRKFLYVGHTGYYKNTKELENLAERIPRFEGAHIGRGTIKGWKKLSDFADLTPEYMTGIAKEYDFFINVSTADAQATTILEAMCLGFPVAATRESGYPYESIIELKPLDTEHNIRQVEKMQNMSEDELFERVRQNRQNALDFHNWDIFCKKIIDFVYDGKVSD